MIKTAAEQSEIVVCEDCGETIYQCDSCKEYLIPRMVIYCDEKGKHFCEDCGERVYPPTRRLN
jgi:hypothetical protein